MEHVIRLLQEELNIPQKSKLIISVSGGADSMMLLSILKDSSYPIEVVHFNHMKREQSKIEADLVRTYCEQNNIPFHYYLIEINKGNFHNQAHKLRLHYLKDVAKVTKSKYIITAHHLDDLFENILIKLTRGSNLLGYAGMQIKHVDKNITFLKPLLYLSKEDILRYVKDHKIPFFNDESNEEDHYLRNRYRHAIVPIMKQENPNLLNQMAQYNKQVTSAFEFIRKTTISLLNHSDEIDLALYATLDDAIKDDMIAFLLEKKHLNVSYEIITSIKKMLLQKKPNQSYALSKKCFFIKAYDKASIKHITPIKNVEIMVNEGENITLNVDNFTFLFNSNAHTEDLEKLCYNKLAFPLWLRHRKNGDQLSYKYGHKKLKDLLIDEKIPTEERKKLWLLTDANDDILWVQNLYINQTLGNKHCIYFNMKESTHA
jgi:bifunctional protein TilS/HprT